MVIRLVSKNRSDNFPQDIFFKVLNQNFSVKVKIPMRIGIRSEVTKMKPPKSLS